jgi:hypothetical protein
MHRAYIANYIKYIHIAPFCSKTSAWLFASFCIEIEKKKSQAVFTDNHINIDKKNHPQLLRQEQPFIWPMVIQIGLGTGMYRHGMCFRASSVFVISILFWFPQRTHYFWHVFWFLFMEHKQYESWHLYKMIKYTFIDVSTKNSEPTYWTLLFVMPKMYFIYKVDGKNAEGL